MKASELVQLEISDLKQKLVDLQQQSFNLRMQKVAEQKPKPHVVRLVRRDIARVKTMITQKMNEGMQS